MSGERPRYRVFLELSVISIVIYIFLGAPGFPSSVVSTSDDSHHASTAKARMDQLVSPSRDLECAKPNYSVHIFSTNPLVLYINNFLSSAEADHLIADSAPKWQISTVFDQHGAEITDDAVRRSERAPLTRDHTVQCIEQRALALQGWPADTYIERLWSQRYNVSGHYALHHDWGMAAGSAARQSRRVSSFMVYLDDQCVGGGTHFPRLHVTGDEDWWCRFVECAPQGSQKGKGNEEEGAPSEGVTFRPRKGSAVFWMNFDADGNGNRDTLHAGLPVREGTKVGLNIWTWYHAPSSRAREL